MTQVLLLQICLSTPPAVHLCGSAPAAVWMFLDLYLYDVVGSSVSSAPPQLESGRMLPSFITLHSNRLETQPSQTSTPTLTQGRPDPVLEGRVPAAFSVLPGFHQGKWGPRWKRCLPGRTEILAGLGSRRAGHPCWCQEHPLRTPHTQGLLKVIQYFTRFPNLSKHRLAKSLK